MIVSPVSYQPILVIIPFLTGSIADIDRRIAFLVNLRSLYPRTHQEYIKCVNLLANERRARYLLSGDEHDRDKSILHCTETILLSPISRADYSGNHVVQLLLNLANYLLERFKEFGQSEDIKYSIEYIRYLRELALDSFAVPKNDITTILIKALGIQVEKWGSRVGTQNIKEMLILCRGLLTTNLSADIPAVAFQSLSQAVDFEFCQGRAQSVDQVVECVQDAAKMSPPDSHAVLYALARTLSTRFAISNSMDDYEEATELLDRILDPNKPGECPDLIRNHASTLVTELAFMRSTIFQNPQYSEVTISRLRAFLSSPSVDEQSRLIFTGALSMEVRRRFGHYDIAESLKEANSSTSQVVDLSSSGSQEQKDIYFLC